MKVVYIFLDIDGVLLPIYQDYVRIVSEKITGKISATEQNKLITEYFDKSAVGYLEFLIDQIEKNARVVRIVISSNWRLNITVEELKEIFSEHIFLAKRIFDKTPDNGMKRAGEISTWLSNNEDKVTDSDFIVLDDLDDGLSEKFEEKFIQCTYSSELKSDILQQEQVSQALKVLKLNVTVSQLSLFEYKGDVSKAQGIKKTLLDKLKPLHSEIKNKVISESACTLISIINFSIIPAQYDSKGKEFFDKLEQGIKLTLSWNSIAKERDNSTYSQSENLLNQMIEITKNTLEEHKKSLLAAPAPSWSVVNIP